MTTTPPKTTNSLPFAPLTPDSIEIERGRGRASSPSPSDPGSPSPAQGHPRRRSRSRLTSLSLRRRPASVIHMSSEPVVLTADALLAIETDADKRLAASLPALPSQTAHATEGSSSASSDAGMDDLKTPTAPSGNGIRARVLSLSRRTRPAGVVHMSSEPNLSGQAQAQAIAESLLARRRAADGRADSASIHGKPSEPAVAKPRARVLSLSLRRRPTSMVSPAPAGAPTAQALAEALAAGTPPTKPAVTLPMTPPPSEPRTSVENEADVKSVTSVESGAAAGQGPDACAGTAGKKRARVLSLSMKRPGSILRRQGSVTSVSSGSKSHNEEPMPINPSYVQSQLDEARASLRSKEGEVVVLEHERDAMRRELEDARNEMKGLQEAIEEKREELGSLEEVQTALAIREELKQAKEAANVQDELVGFLQGRLAELELTSEAERRAKLALDERVAASEAECGVLREDKSRLEAESSKKTRELSELQTRNSQILARAAELDAQKRERAAKVAELEAALREARDGRAAAEASLQAALERVAALEEERAQSAAQEEAMRLIEEERRELLARLHAAQNGSAQAHGVPQALAARRHTAPRRSSWASLWVRLVASRDRLHAALTGLLARQANPYVEILGVVAAVLGTRALLWWLGQLDLRELFSISSCDAGAFAHGCLRAIGSSSS
ncbi:hypothetical protein DAEQUDRAFT_568465 [Daedalea quercina L-15889]|uniref:Uncharacterized protein n=1 Tax=Daedalea quercina L-15889 TaxID=1314783 RepID=A0A165LVJ8_9APHY|nr:hypothetical protein DAEQUDRAFT_568465 [Daedalea quercina L-15889]